MRLSYLAFIVPCLGLVAGQSSLLDLLAEVPSCAQQCIVPVIAADKCKIDTLATMASCLCTDLVLQREISSCTQRSCNYTDQVVVVGISNSVCIGYPIQSRSKEIEMYGIALISIMAPFVLLRLFTRYMLTKRLWWDDFIVIIASLLAAAIFGLEIRMASRGFGKHLWNINPTIVPDIQLAFYISQILYVLAQVLTKISILIFYLRIFPKRIFRILTIISIIFIALHGVIFTFIVAFQCLPVYALWNAAVLPNAKCLSQDAIVLVGAASSIFQDCLVLALPIPCIKSLQIGTGKRISLIIMFSIGSFACITSMIRLRYIFGFGDYTDATWDNVDVFNWSCIEIATAVVCTCLPSLRGLMTRMFPRFFGASSSSSHINHFQMVKGPGMGASSNESSTRETIDDSESGSRIEDQQEDRNGSRQSDGKKSDSSEVSILERGSWMKWHEEDHETVNEINRRRLVELRGKKLQSSNS